MVSAAGSNHVAGAVDPRFRQRWVQARRAEGRRRLRILLGIAGLVVLVTTALAVLHSPLVAASRISVMGAPAAETTSILQVAGLAGDPPMIDVDAGAAQRRLEALPWVASASVRKAWPSTVRVTLEARIAVAAVPEHSGVALVDETGAVIDVGPAAPAGLPLVPGLSAGRPGSRVSPGLPGAGNEAALGEVLRTAHQLMLQGFALTRLEEPSPGGLGVVLGPGTGSGADVLLGDDSQLGAKITSLEALRAAGALGGGVTLVNLTAPSDPVLTPDGGTSTVSTASGG